MKRKQLISLLAALLVLIGGCSMKKKQTVKESFEETITESSSVANEIEFVYVYQYESTGMLVSTVIENDMLMINESDVNLRYFQYRPIDIESEPMNCYWVSSDESILSIDSGFITVKGSGECIVYCYVDDVCVRSIETTVSSSAIPEEVIDLDENILIEPLRYVSDYHDSNDYSYSYIQFLDSNFYERDYIDILVYIKDPEGNELEQEYHCIYDGAADDDVRVYWDYETGTYVSIWFDTRYGSPDEYGVVDVCGNFVDDRINSGNAVYIHYTRNS